MLEKYGQCELIANKGDSFIVIFKNVYVRRFPERTFSLILIAIIFRAQVEAFVNNKNALENEYGVKVQVFGRNESTSTHSRVSVVKTIV